MSSTRITWQDVMLAPDDGQRYEAIEGSLYVTPAPSVLHQLISGNLFDALRRLLHHPSHGIVLAAPVGVQFPATDEGVQPDIVFVSADRLNIVGADWVRGAPDLVVEIVSPGTAARDRKLKRALYQRQGVGEYWIVDPEARAVEVWRFAAEASSAEIYDRIPVRLGDTIIGHIDTVKIFPADS